MAYLPKIDSNHSIKELPTGSQAVGPTPNKVTDSAVACLENSFPDPTLNLSDLSAVQLNDESLIFITPAKTGVISPSKPPMHSTEINIHLRVEEEAKRQCYTFNAELMVYINEEGDGKTWDDFYNDLQSVKFMVPGDQPFEPQEKEISIKSSSRKAVKEEPKEQEISLKSGSRKAVKEVSAKTNTNNNTSFIHPEKEKIDFLTGHLLQFDSWVAGLTDAGWQFSEDAGVVFNAEGDMFQFDDEVKRFSILKNNFRSHLESFGFQYDEKTETIYKGKIPATFAEVTEVVKAYLPEEPETQVNPDSTKRDIFNLFAPQLQFDAFLTKMEDLRYKVDYEKRYAVINGVSRTFDQLRETSFLPMQQRFFSYIKSQGYSYDLTTQELSKGNEPATLWQAESLKTGFRHYYCHPDFEEVKAGMKPLMNYNDFMKVLANRGYKISIEQEMILHDNWVIQWGKTQLKFEEYGFRYHPKTCLYEKNQKVFTLDQLYDTMKTVLLKVLEERAEEQLQLKYDKPSNHFRNESCKMTTEEVLHQLMIMDFGL